MSITDQIDDLRRAGRHLDALQSALDVLRTTDDGLAVDRMECWSKHFQGQPCLLWQTAHALRKESDVRNGTSKLNQYLTSLADNPIGPAGGLFRAHALFFTGALESTDENIRRHLLLAVQAFDGEWGLPAEGPHASLGRQPSSPGRSKPVVPTGGLPGVDERWSTVLRSIELETGPSVGLLVVRDLLWRFWGETAEPTFDDMDLPPPVSTWVLLLADVPRGKSKERWPLMGRLSLCPMPWGCGRVYPDPMKIGYLGIDSTFRQGIQFAIKGSALADADFDVCWSLDVKNPNDPTQPAVGQLAGHSAEVAMACGFMALRHREPLDPHAVVTAQFDTKDTTRQKLALLPTGVGPKLRTGELTARHIDTVVVAVDQPEFEWFGNALTPAKDLESAYYHLTLYRRMTREACRSIAKREDELLRERCAPWPYVGPSMSREKKKTSAREPGMEKREGPDATSLGGMMDVDEGERWQALPPEQVENLRMGRLDEVREFALGQWSAEGSGTYGTKGPAIGRVYIRADSGSGKSVHLMDSNVAIARADDERLPILVPHLGDFDWTDNDEVLRKLVAQFNGDLPSELQQHTASWFKRLMSRGEVVWLLDALDEADGGSGLGEYFDPQRGPVRNCPAILTLRRSAEVSGLSSAMRGASPWLRLRLDPFDDSRLARLVGEGLARTLQEHKNHSYWAPLLGSPLLAGFLGTLAQARELDGLTNRLAVYDRIIEHLVNDFNNNKRKAMNAAAIDRDEVRAALSPIAWTMLVDRNFSMIAEGPARTGLESKLRASGISLNNMDAINLVTRSQVIDVGGATRLRFAFRHRSFGEYYAGLHVADASRSSTAFAQVEPMLSEHGRHPEWRWTLRFALMQAAADAQDSLDRLAEALIKVGNPMIVTEAIRNDLEHGAGHTTVSDDLLQFARDLQKYDYELQDALGK